MLVHGLLLSTIGSRRYNRSYIFLPRPQHSRMPVQAQKSSHHRRHVARHTDRQEETFTKKAN
jgi:hypothetical protein